MQKKDNKKTKGKKNKTYIPPKIKIYDIKELLMSWDNELFGLPTGGPSSPVGPV
jgi:hypothetical protein